LSYGVSGIILLRKFLPGHQVKLPIWFVASQSHLWPIAHHQVHNL